MTTAKAVEVLGGDAGEEVWSQKGNVMLPSWLDEDEDTCQVLMVQMRYGVDEDEVNEYWQRLCWLKGDCSHRVRMGWP